MPKLRLRQKAVSHFAGVVLLLLMLSPAAFAQVPAGYAEYFVPGGEDAMSLAFLSLGAPHTVLAMHSRITITAWSDNARIYYDHWENDNRVTGAGRFDPASPEATADEKFTLLTTGQVLVLDNTPAGGIPIPRTTTAPYRYDGGDRIYVAGGTVTVTRVSYPQIRNTVDPGLSVQAAAWEVYPVKPQLTTYVLPFGENLATGTPAMPAFERTFVLVQATADGTTFSVDLDGNGTYDGLDTDYNGTVDATEAAIKTFTLNAGETFFLGNVGANPVIKPRGAYAVINRGAVIQGTSTLQVKFVVGDPNGNYQTRGISAFPRGFWTKDYYAPVGSPATNTAAVTDLFLYNPHATALTVNWESQAGGGSFTIDPGTTASFAAKTPAGSLPAGGGVYLRGSDVFWGVSMVDSTGQAYEWAYSLLPSTLLYSEHFLGWAPDGDNMDASGVFLTVAQDNTRIWVDYDNNGTADQTLTLNRLQTEYITDTVDGDLSGAHFWATGPFTMAFGQNPDTAPTQASSGDLGYVAIPGSDFISLVLGVEKSANPQIIPTGIGSQTTFTIRVHSARYTVEGAQAIAPSSVGYFVTDTLPAGWEIVPGSTVTITRPDKTTVSGNTVATTFPTVTGSRLQWSNAQVGGASCAPGAVCMAENQEILISFTARTIAAFNLGDVSQNKVVATGTRTVAGYTQTFNTSDYAYVTHSSNYGAIAIDKQSNASVPLYPGNTFTYTTIVTNNTTAPLTSVTLYDPLPPGATATGSTTLSRSTVADTFSTLGYAGNNGTRNWNGNWIEANDGGNDIVVNAAGQLQLDNSNSNEPTVTRTANLTAAGTPTSAVLALTYSTNTGVDTTDHFYVQVSNGGAYTTVGDITNIAGAVGPRVFTYDISAYISATTSVRFTFPNNSYQRGSETIYVDNVSITYNVTATGGAAPDFLSASQGYALLAGQNLTATFNATVDKPLASGITEITNVASTTSSQFPIQISDSVTNIVVNPTVSSASVAGRVWFDVEGNALQDVGEPGLANVEVTLKDLWGTPVATAFTDVNGRYLFTGVLPGNGYYVQVTASTLPAGLLQSGPAGRSDNRRAAFNLTAGQAVVGQDLGYRSAGGVAAVGDLVWVDANSNQVRDPGEIGLGGVTVTIFLDANGNGVYDAGVDTDYTTVSEPDGSYLRTGLPATGTQDYVIKVAATPAGYTATTAISYSVKDMVAGSAVLTMDFGFLPGSSFTLKDRVWFDSDGSLTYNGAETGIAGVTVELLDKSRNVIGTTTTVADGTFTFSGLPGGGADYTTRISDLAGVLSDYFGTTTAAKARENAEINLSANRDWSSSGPAYGNYGFLVTRAIGDTVFSDTNGNGTQDPGEAGIAGVVVTLFKDDVANGTAETGETIGTVTTDASGHYLFAGLANGWYVASVANITGYTYTGSGATADSYPGITGTQRRVQMAGANILTVDLGFLATSPHTISGVVWSDTNRDGSYVGEPRLASITLDVVVGATNGVGGTVVATVTTDSNGQYSVPNLAAQTYTVRITDTTGLLTGDETTFERTEQLAAPFNYYEDVVLGSTDVTNVNFGYIQPLLTYASLAYLRSYASGGSVVVEWRTSVEVGTAGFRLERLGPDGQQYEPVTGAAVPGLPDHRHGGTYRVRDAGALLGQPLVYRLVEIETSGRERVLGPYATTPDDAGPTTASLDLDSKSFHREPNPIPERRQRELKAMQLELRRARVLQDPAMRASQGTGHQAPEPCDPPEGVPTRRQTAILKITTRGAGLTSLSAVQIAGAVGLSSQAVSGSIRAGRLSLSTHGQAVPWLALTGDSGLAFYAESGENAYTKDNVYWLAFDSGVRMATTTVAAAGGVAATSFQDTAHAEQDLFSAPAAVQDPSQDIWVWETLLAGVAGDDTRTFPIQAPDAAGTGDTALVARFVGGTEGQRAEVSLNGFTLGEAAWTGRGAYETRFVVSPGDVLAGANTVTVRAIPVAGVDPSSFFVNSFDLVYERLLRAQDGWLDFTAQGGTLVTVAGFAAAEVVVLDITEPGTPALVQGYEVAPGAGGGFEVRMLVPGDQPRRYVVQLASRALAPTRVARWTNSRLAGRSNRADYVLIAPDSLVAAAEELADYRRGQGLETRVIRLDDIYDHYSYGVAEPLAIRRFLAFASSSWDLPPRYVTLVGRGTYDYKDVEGYGDNLVPTLLAASPRDGLFATDIPYADLSGDDGVPEIAIGRLPVLTAGSLRDYIAKVKVHEGTEAASWRRHVVLAAEKTDTAGNFTADSERLATLASPPADPERIYLDTIPIADARTALFAALASGTALLNYVGHGGYDRLSNDGLLTTADIPLLANDGKLPVVLGMTCIIGDATVPGYPSIGELLLLEKGKGAYAVWSPTGLSANQPAALLNSAFFQAVFVDRQPVIGDAINTALQRFSAPQARYLRSMYNLLGEPVARLPMN